MKEVASYLWALANKHHTTIPPYARPHEPYTPSITRVLLKNAFRMVHKVLVQGFIAHRPTGVASNILPSKPSALDEGALDQLIQQLWSNTSYRAEIHSWTQEEIKYVLLPHLYP